MCLTLQYSTASCTSSCSTFPTHWRPCDWCACQLCVINRQWSQIACTSHYSQHLMHDMSYLKNKCLVRCDVTPFLYADPATGRSLGLDYKNSATPTCQCGIDAAQLGLQLCAALRDLHSHDLVYSPRLEPGRLLLNGTGGLVLRPYRPSDVDAVLHQGHFLRWRAHCTCACMQWLISIMSELK